jgi:predicted Zn-dependent protease
LLLALLASTIIGCVTNPATGENEFSLMSPAQEQQVGAEADQQIVAQYGLYQDQAVSTYVDQLGQKVASHAESPGYPFTFRVLDSPVINAFALPGGYVYVTRGLLAYLENDAQLAVVLGHEIGHITARHAAKQYTQAQIANIGLGLGSVLFEEIRPFLGAAQSGLQLLFLKFSRDHETQSDDLGVKYATRAGYDAKQGSEFFHTLERLSNQEQGGKLPTWASTHPDPGDRKTRVAQLAAQYAADIKPEGGLTGADPAAYLPRLENIVFGPDPRQGFVEGSTFYHPALKFQFPVPSGWGVFNFATAVQMAPSSGEAVIEMSTAANTTPDAVADAFISANGASVTSRTSVNVNGFPAVRVLSTVTGDDGQGQQISIGVLSYFINKDGLVYIFHGYTLAASFSQYGQLMESVFSNFRQVTDAGVLAVQPYHLDVFAAPQTAPFSSLVTPSGPKRGVDLTMDVAHLAILNQREVSDQVQVGAQLKQLQ